MKLYTDANAIASLFKAHKESRTQDFRTYLDANPLPISFSDPHYAKLYGSVLSMALYKKGATVDDVDLFAFHHVRGRKFPWWWDGDLKYNFRETCRNYLNFDLTTFCAVICAVRRIDPTLLTYMPQTYREVVPVDIGSLSASDRTLHDGRPIQKNYVRHTPFDISCLAAAPYLYGHARGHLRVIDSPLHGLVPDSSLTVVCAICQDESTITLDQLSSLVACPRCTSRLAIPDLTVEAALERSKSFIPTKINLLKKEAIHNAQCKYAAKSHREGHGYEIRNNDRPFFLAFNQQIQRIANEEISSMWRFESESDFINYTGLPVTQHDQLHRIGHEDEDGGPIVYSPGQVMWMPLDLNAGLHYSNTRLLYNGETYTSQKAACAAAGVNYGTFRSRLSRAKETAPDILAQVVFDALLPCNTPENPCCNADLT